MDQARKVTSVIDMARNSHAPPRFDIVAAHANEEGSLVDDRPFIDSLKKKARTRPPLHPIDRMTDRNAGGTVRLAVELVDMRPFGR